MIAPNACGGKGFAKGFALSSVAAAMPEPPIRYRRDDHAFVKQFIMLPDFGPAGVNLACDISDHRVRLGAGLGFLSPPAPRDLCRPALRFCSV